MPNISYVLVCERLLHAVGLSQQDKLCMLGVVMAFPPVTKMTSGEFVLTGNNMQLFIRSYLHANFTAYVSNWIVKYKMEAE